MIRGLAQMARNMVDRWKHPWEDAPQRARRRYLESLGLNARPLEPAPVLHVTCVECGLAHRTWEFCPVRSPKMLRVGGMVQSGMEWESPEERLLRIRKSIHNGNSSDDAR